jgi:hypothetical protein
MTSTKSEEVNRKVHKLLDKGLIRESLSPCTIPVVLTPKNNGEWQMCTYSLDINKIIVKYRFHLPIMHYLMDCLSGVEYFMKTDLKSCYHQIQMREGDEWKKLFKTKYGLF